MRWPYDVARPHVAWGRCGDLGRLVPMGLGGVHQVGRMTFAQASRELRSAFRDLRQKVAEELTGTFIEPLLRRFR